MKNEIKKLEQIKQTIKDKDLKKSIDTKIKALKERECIAKN